MLPARILDDRIASLFGSHIDRTDNEKPRNFRKDRRINDAQTLCVSDAKVAIKNSFFVVVGADFAGTAGMMSPGTVLHELGEL